MKKYIIILLSGVVVVAAVVYFLIPRTSSPLKTVQSLLPATWASTVTANTTPLEWKGPANCTKIASSNPAEVYQEPNAPGDFKYKAFHSLWFCPKDWQGIQSKIEGAEQRYPARLLCRCRDYTIFHFSLGENSQKDFPAKIEELFH